MTKGTARGRGYTAAARRGEGSLTMVRIGLIGLGAVLGHPDLSITTPHGAWAATLASSLFVAFALACSIPMRLPVASAVVGTAVVIPKI